jgi:formylmethanofuran dehydrogenase subunit E
MNRQRALLAIALLIVFVAVALDRAPETVLAQQAAAGSAGSAANEAALKDIAFVHGGTGPFAVAGYRIGERAMKELGVPRSSFSIEVVHHTPAEVQWTCIADGVQAATGASVGKMNLKIEPAGADAVETVVRDKNSGRTLVFRLQPSFVKRYWNLPHEKLNDAGREALALPDDAIFTMQSK